jgi:hypothetical protein
MAEPPCEFLSDTVGVCWVMRRTQFMLRFNVLIIILFPDLGLINHPNFDPTITPLLIKRCLAVFLLPP